MAGFGFWPVAVQPLGNVASGTLLWRVSGRLHVTVVVKARFDLVHDSVAQLAAPEPVAPDRGEMAPFLGQTDVVVTAAHAHACPPAPVTAVAVRVAVIRDWPLLDKRLLVYGEDPRRGAGRSLFTRAPVVVARGPIHQAGVLLNPRDPNRSVGFGWLSPDDPSRSTLLRGRDAPESAAGVMDIDEGFAWEYFQVAPADQRIPYLRGDEWIVLDGFHPSLPRVECRLPAAHADVRVYPPSMQVAEGANFHVAMQLDRLNIDADALRCCLLWRGSFPVADEASARALTLLAALTTPDGELLPTQAGQPIDQPISQSTAGAGVDGGGLEGPAGAPDTTDSDEETRRLRVARPPGTAAEERQVAIEEGVRSASAHGGPSGGGPAKTDSSTPVREPPPSRPATEPGIDASDSELGPATVRMGARAPDPATPMEPGLAPGGPAPPLKARPTIPYQERPAPDDGDGISSSAFAPPAEEASVPSENTASPPPAQSGVAVRAGEASRRHPSDGSAGADGAVTQVRESSPGTEVPGRPRRGPVILPSRAEMPLYLPSEAKRWARVAPRTEARGASAHRGDGAPLSSRLELNAEGALSVRYLREPALESDDGEPPTRAAPEQADVSETNTPVSGASWSEAKQFGAGARLLRPQPVAGAPWTSASRAEIAGPPSVASMSPADLPLVTVDDLEGTMSEVLSVRDGDVEIVDEATGATPSGALTSPADIDDEETSVSGGSRSVGPGEIDDEETSVSEGSRPAAPGEMIDEETSVSGGALPPAGDGGRGAT